MCYSPNEANQESVFKQDSIKYDKNLHSQWTKIGRSVFQSTKTGHQLLIRDLLDSHDTLNENYE